MKKICHIFLLLNAGLFAQQKKTFSLSDSIVTPGQKHICYLIYELAKADLRSESMPTIDSIVTFLKKIPGTKIEIGVHADSRAKPSSSTRITMWRASAIRDSLIRKGIDGQRLTARGYEGSQLLIADETIKKQKTKQAQEELHAKNRRTEIKIISVN